MELQIITFISVVRGLGLFDRVGFHFDLGIMLLQCYWRLVFVMAGELNTLRDG
ncbi:hypothetical protein HanXRQr2_Chr01g0042241 [Helianthus annuus]|uniref:Uncharacterized protein n=1 Tax=Helianthus annuus TaxID=4232 RepID=A0A9K3JYV8_HELAN|nr:hypothetical protein HanXRQr2_Chr01g0042241 [Helianthus annuus]KAJ0958635.1 hypothetical protein HanPSC8_Chr01g0041091 [Helianthus annuus]